MPRAAPVRVDRVAFDARRRRRAGRARPRTRGGQRGESLRGSRASAQWRSSTTSRRADCGVRGRGPPAHPSAALPRHGCGRQAPSPRRSTSGAPATAARRGRRAPRLVVARAARPSASAESSAPGGARRLPQLGWRTRASPATRAAMAPRPRATPKSSTNAAWHAKPAARARSAHAPRRAASCRSPLPRAAAAVGRSAARCDAVEQREEARDLRFAADQRGGRPRRRCAAIAASIPERRAEGRESAPRRPDPPRRTSRTPGRRRRRSPSRPRTRSRPAWRPGSRRRPSPCRCGGRNCRYRRPPPRRSRRRHGRQADGRTRPTACAWPRECRRRRAARARIVAVRDRRAEHAHDRVADVLVDGAPPVRDEAVDEVEVAGEQPVHVLGVEGARQLRDTPRDQRTAWRHAGARRRLDPDSGGASCGARRRAALRAEACVRGEAAWQDGQTVAGGIAR